MTEPPAAPPSPADAPAAPGDRAGVLRILDANLNRANEAFRVAEEYARFVRDDPAATATLKAMRHDLRAADDLLRAGTPEPLERYRDTAGDVGTAATTVTEGVRVDGAAVARAALKRLQESLRALEEYGKTVAPEAARRFEALRYRVYDLEPRLLSGDDRMRRLREARLYVLVTERLASTDALTVTREAVAGGAQIIQLREKELEDGAYLERARAMAEICRDGGALLLLNDRAHLVALAGADGVHTGWGDLPIHRIRRFVGLDRIIGRSTSGPDWAARAHAEGADYIGAGPVYPTRTKEHRAAVGLEYVRWVASESPLPYFCIGSINRQTLAGVLDAGARAVAVCTAIINAPDIAAEAAHFRAQLDLR